jgi:oxygen-independent coproporphyrinogen-3 oxidase
MGFGIYIHFPYCLSKCPYCDFASQVTAPPQQRYSAAVAREARLRAEAASGRRASTLYVGGGTPSLWEPAALGEALEAIRSLVPIDPRAEATLEANPGASDCARFEAYRALGINRLSIGAQSFDDATLKALGRRHSSAQIRTAFEAARAAGFGNVSLDLIYGAPGQSIEGARRDAEQAVALNPEHLSCYGLMLDGLEIKTPMARAVEKGTLTVPDDDAQWEMGRAIAEALVSAGHRRYEISSWARPGFESRHNTLYWTGAEYLGLGAGAVGFALDDPSEPSRGGRRWGNLRSATRYLEAIEAGQLPEQWSERLEAADLLRERMAVGLRRVEGVDFEEACRTLRQDPEPIRREARKLVARGLAELEGGTLRLNERGLDFHTEAAMAFV